MYWSFLSLLTSIFSSFESFYIFTLNFFSLSDFLSFLFSVIQFRIIIQSCCFAKPSIYIFRFFVSFFCLSFRPTLFPNPHISLPSLQRVFQREGEGQGTWWLPETQRKTAIGGGSQGRLYHSKDLQFWHLTMKFNEMKCQSLWCPVANTFKNKTEKITRCHKICSFTIGVLNIIFILVIRALKYKLKTKIKLCKIVLIVIVKTFKDIEENAFDFWNM